MLCNVVFCNVRSDWIMVNFVSSVFSPLAWIFLLIIFLLRKQIISRTRVLTIFDFFSVVVIFGLKAGIPFREKVAALWGGLAA